MTTTSTHAPTATTTPPQATEAPRWRVADVEALFAMPFNDLLFKAQQIHREHFDPNAVQRSTLLSIKTGGCSEDCGYCSQSARYDTGLERERLLPLDEVLENARAAKAKGASRFCMGAAWRGPKDKDLEPVLEMVREVKALGLETCVTLGMLKDGQAAKLKDAGLDYYNHNIDTAPEFYGQVITTHTLQDRLDTLDRVRDAGINVCCGGIVGLGEGRKSRAALIAQLANMDPQPDSVPINNLVRIEGTPMGENEEVDPIEFVRTIAAARITMPKAYVRLSAGRQQMSDEMQALCFLAGANSMFYGDRLLTTDNPEADRDETLFAKLGLKAI
ncbi:biotin synthase BioB [Nitrogeniibacter mangrovi]|uniref:Biotin synthase n=1 Tax=Nitrogeniibacter mangrovi TaxID=2016596 RepID=A0A6C1B6Y8_9RHOO|nr:biotin synthase BioB [Nitrogeniibacter mangrovi]QID18498.1 biotin synthase BioB [Nitrogeniibacter mangrovi]